MWEEGACIYGTPGVHNNFSNLSNSLLQAVIGEAKSNFSSRLILKPITTNYLWFVVKM